MLLTGQEVSASALREEAGYVVSTFGLVAAATSLTDELVVARCDLDLARLYRQSTFDFARHRRTEHYGLITERTGVVPPGTEKG